jgi:hypothetical protein
LSKQPTFSKATIVTSNGVKPGWPFATVTGNAHRKGDSLEKVIEKLATTLAREVGGKVRVTSGSWDGEKVILKNEVLEIRNVDGRLYVSRKARKPDEWDPPIAAYDP